MVGRLIGYGMFLLGLGIVIAGWDYRLSIGPIGAAPPAGEQDRVRISVAFWVILAGGCTGLIGACAAHAYTKLIARDPDPSALDLGKWHQVVIATFCPACIGLVTVTYGIEAFLLSCVVIFVVNLLVGMWLYRGRDGLIILFLFSATVIQLSCIWLLLWCWTEWVTP